MKWLLRVRHSGHTCSMRVRLVLAVALLALLGLTASCSSSTVFEADPSLALNDAPVDDAAESSDSATTAEADPAPTETPDAPAGDDAESALGGTNRTLTDEQRQTQFEGLAELCRTNDTRACDVLFLISPIDSDFETLGSTCNGAGIPESGWCTDGIETGLDGLVFDEASPALNAMATSCSDGDMMACDFLYFFSPGGGQWEAFGDGCGERTTSAFPDCRTAFPEG